MASVTTTQGVPSSIEAGDEYHFTTSYADYPVGTWTAALVLVQGTGTPSSTAATISGTNFLFTLTSAATAALGVAGTGQYQFSIYVTASGQRATAETGLITLLPNLAVARTPSFAEAQVTLLQGVLAAFNATDKYKVDFNGQMFERARITDYQKQLVYYQAAVIREQQALKAQRGEHTGGRVDAFFVPQWAGPYLNPYVR
jgi:hypothetical protein